MIAPQKSIIDFSGIALASVTQLAKELGGGEIKLDTETCQATIYLPAGIYPIERIQFQARVKIQGAGQAETIPARNLAS
jgi:hypothetical protein